MTKIVAIKENSIYIKFNTSVIFGVIFDTNFSTLKIMLNIALYCRYNFISNIKI